MSDVEALVRALLYEGYVLYPYRPSSVKNRRRFPFGGVFPPAWTRENEHDRCEATCQVLVRENRRGDARVRVSVRFLHQRDSGALAWQEAEEREVGVTRPLPALVGVVDEVTFGFEGNSQRTIHGSVRLRAETVTEGLLRLCLSIRNETGLAAMDRDEATMRSFASTHALIAVEGAELVSLIDPPEELREAAAACSNAGLWPVLVGEERSHAAMLASPIILYDYPRVAPESPGDLFDATEIDEILTLRILTLTEEERREILAAGGRARALLERTDALRQADIARLHGAIRDRASSPSGLSPGDRVRLRPRRRADAFDVVLAGRSATIATIEEAEGGEVLFTVTIDDDPGKDLGREGFVGHRFFFHAEEVERLA